MPYKRSQRRRRSSSGLGPARPITRRWNRWFQKLPKGAVAAIVYGCLLAIGIALLYRGGTINTIPATVACAVGVMGLLWQGWRTTSAWRDANRSSGAAAERTERRRRRRTRETNEQKVKRERAAADAAAHERAKAVQEAARIAHNKEQSNDQDSRRIRDESIARDAMQILTMSELSLVNLARDLFGARGFRVVQPCDEAPGDMELHDANGETRIVARMTPHGRKADVPDVNALDAWRVDVGAGSAILYGLAGFTPAAVRLAAELPLTLAEPYLLAQWRALESEAKGRTKRRTVARRK